MTLHANDMSGFCIHEGDALFSVLLDSGSPRMLRYDLSSDAFWSEDRAYGIARRFLLESYRNRASGYEARHINARVNLGPDIWLCVDYCRPLLVAAAQFRRYFLKRASA